MLNGNVILSCCFSPPPATTRQEYHWWYTIAVFGDICIQGQVFGRFCTTWPVLVGG